MEKLCIDLKNCYGIRSLKCELDFDQENKSYAIYAQNGIMKTSFAKTFQDLSKGKNSSDRMYANRVTERTIYVDDNELDKENVFVIEPYDKDFESGKISMLLANKNLRERYEKLHKDIDERKENFLKGLMKSGYFKKADACESLLAEDIVSDKKDFFGALKSIEYKVEDETERNYVGIVYNKIFNDKTIVKLENSDFSTKLKKYIEHYDELISKSKFFKKGIFNHNNAEEVAKKLKENGFFEATHTVNINIDGEKTEIKNEKELQEAIGKEKDIILNDSKLQELFDEVDKMLTGNAALKEFRELITANQILLPELANLPLLKRKLWVTYIRENKNEYFALLELYRKSEEELKIIINAAKKEQLKWYSVVKIFNKRFSVPFVVKIENQDDVVLKNEVASLSFEFDDCNHEENSVEIGKSQLFEVLSNGERRALYLLNIIFEIEARKESEQKTLFIIDDIADSFDYKNKYAIVEYLADMCEVNNFYQIILSHNFDFYRTVCGRLGLDRKKRRHAIKNIENEIIIKEEYYQKNPFKNWSNNLGNDKYLVASIPFVRNLAEYCNFNNEHKKLTSLVHIKEDTDKISKKELISIFARILNTTIDCETDETTMRDIIFNCAQTSVNDVQNLNKKNSVELEDKIILSIAIRLIAEDYMIEFLKKHNLKVDEITRNQTIELIKIYKENFSDRNKEIEILESVNLMTPENIHLNSFMYEPILDMSVEHLVKLYKTVSGLQGEF